MLSVAQVAVGFPVRRCNAVLPLGLQRGSPWLRAELAVPAWRAFAAGRPRDPERPKLPVQPWIQYLSHFRKNKQQLAPPTATNRDLMKLAASKWKTLDEATKAPWVKPYAEEKAKYDKAFKLYTDSGKKAAWQRDPEMPKRPITGFLQFAMEYRSKHVGLKVTESTKAAGVQWKAFTPLQKAPYEKQFVDGHKKWKEASAAYKTSGKEAAWRKRVGLDVLDAKKAKEAAKKLEQKKLDKVKEKLKARAQKLKEATAARKVKEAAKAKLAKEKARAVAKKIREKAAMAAAKRREAEKKGKENAKAALKKQKEKSVLKKEVASKKDQGKAKPAAAVAKPAAAAAKPSATKKP